MPSSQIQIDSCYTEIDARDDGPDLLVELEGRLKHLKSDGTVMNDFGRVGPVECPIAYDSSSGTAYRYVCESGVMVKDFSQLRAFSIKTGKASVVWDMPLNQWALWFLEWIPRLDGPGGQLFGLVAMDRPSVDGQVSIEHRLFAIEPGNPAPKFRPLCRDAYKPLAFNRQRRELAFSGAEGTYIIGMRGERLATLSPDELPTAHGAAFDPSGKARIALGGYGIYLWDFEKHTCRQLCDRGRYPVWPSDGQTLWYAGSSGTLMRYHFETDQVETVLAIQPDRFPDFWKSRSVTYSRCGRYLGAMLSAKRLKGITQSAGGIEAKERVFIQSNCFCVIDLERSEFWRIEDRYFPAFRWIGSKRPL